MDLSIIIVNYNVKEFLLNLLHSIEKASEHLTKEIIIVDNASDDGSVEFIRSKFPSVILIDNKTNVGFGKANNQGLAVAKGEYILLINPDTVVSEDTFEKMIAFFNSHPEAGLAGCKILNSDGSLQLACRRSFPGPWTSFTKVTGLSTLFPNSRLFAKYNLTYLDENKTYEVDAISGSFMMMKKEVYEKTGGFDEQFFMYGEDLDLCYRIKKAGFKVYYVHTSRIIHYKGESTKRSSLDETKIFYDAMYVFVKKHFASFFLVEAILRTAIGFRKLFAFLGKRKLIIFTMIADFIFFNLCLFIAEKIYKGMTGWVGFDPSAYYVIYTIPAVIYLAAAFFSGVYKKDRLSVLRNFTSIVFSFLIVTSATFFFKQYAFSRAVVIITFILFIVLTTLFRVILKLFFKVGVKTDGVIHKRLVVVGTNNEAVTIAEKLKLKRSDIHSLIGLISKTSSDIGKDINGFKVLGSIQNIQKILSEQKINEVILSSKELSYGEMVSLVSSNSSNSVDYKIVGTDMNFVVGKTSVSMLDNIPLVEIHYNLSNPMIRYSKILFDYTLGLLALFLVYPFIYFFSKLGSKKTGFIKFVLGVPSVIAGKKSFVGPKNSSNEENKFYGKSGLTGLWYVEENDDTQLEKLDFFYAKNQNIWLDLEILGKTFGKMLNKQK